MISSASGVFMSQMLSCVLGVQRRQCHKGAYFQPAEKDLRVNSIYICVFFLKKSMLQSTISAIEV